MTVKFFTYTSGGAPGLGFEASGERLDFNAAYAQYCAAKGMTAPEPLDMLDALLLVNGSAGVVAEIRKSVAANTEGDVCSLPERWVFDVPVHPSKIIAIGLNYAEHAREGGKEPPAEPMLFAKLPSSLTAHNRPVVMPHGIGRVDHEIELAVVIGRTAAKVPAAEALQYVAGYTIFNDITARDMQRSDAAAGKPNMRSKGYDTFGPCGPCVVPSCFIPDPQSLELTLKVNGAVRQRGATADMLFPVHELIAYISAICTLVPGDLIITGTPAGISPLKPGDTLSAEIDPIGVLVNPVT